MRITFLLIGFLCGIQFVYGFEDTTLEDDDFAEFEQFDAEDDTPVNGMIDVLVVSFASGI